MTKTLNIRVVSFPFRYGVVLGLAKVLTPTLFHQVFNPLVNSEVRPMIRYVKNQGKKSLVGAEIGVFKGNHAVSILNYLPLTRLYLVDPYAPYLQDGTKINPISAQKVALHYLRNYNQVIWVKSEKLPCNLDFVYIDGNHSYEAMKNDLRKYYGKVRKGGVLGGHDFSNQFLGVIKAVSEFVVEKNLDLFVNQPDWWFNVLNEKIKRKRKALFKRK